MKIFHNLPLTGLGEAPLVLSIVVEGGGALGDLPCQQAEAHGLFFGIGVPGALTAGQKAEGGGAVPALPQEPKLCREGLVIPQGQGVCGEAAVMLV